MALNKLAGIGATPYEKKVAMPQNFLNASDYDALKMFQIDGLPGLNQIYGNGLVTGILEKIGSVVYTQSQVVRWAEDRRVHLKYTGVTRAANVFTKAGHTIRKNENVLVSDGTVTEYGLVTAVAGNTFTVVSPLSAGFTVGSADLAVSVLAGTEFLPGTYGMEEGLDPNFDTYVNTKTIVKDSDIISKTHATEILWVKVETGGKEGWFWTLKNSKLKTRFLNQREAKFWLTQQAESGSAMATAGYGKTIGGFDQVRKGGTSYKGFPSLNTDWDDIVAVLDSQGAIATNMLWLNTKSDLDFTRSIKAETELGYGMFQNGKEDAYSMDFRGFDIGGYTFLKTKWKFLNDPTGLGGLEGTGKVHGLLMPMGGTSVYETDNNNASKTVPFVHAVSSKGPDGEDRYMYIDPDAADKDLDAKKVTMLSEFAPVLAGTNNMVIFED